MVLCREKVEKDGYAFVKGKSQSKKRESLAQNSSTDSDSTLTCVKHLKINKDVRDKRISELREDFKDIDDQLVMKDKRRKQAEASRSYKLCDEIMTEIGELKRDRRKVDAELTLFLNKQKRAIAYRKNSNEGMTSTCSSDQESTVVQ